MKQIPPGREPITIFDYFSGEEEKKGVLKIPRAM